MILPSNRMKWERTRYFWTVNLLDKVIVCMAHYTYVKAHRSDYTIERMNLIGLLVNNNELVSVHYL